MRIYTIRQRTKLKELPTFLSVKLWHIAERNWKCVKKICLGIWFLFQKLSLWFVFEVKTQQTTSPFLLLQFHTEQPQLRSSACTDSTHSKAIMPIRTHQGSLQSCIQLQTPHWAQVGFRCWAHQMEAITAIKMCIFRCFQKYYIKQNC